MDATAGKIERSAFERIILPRLGASDPSVLVGPAHGIDVGVVDLGAGTVMAVTTDPLFVMPELGWPRAAWFAVQIVASDAATSGLEPRYMTVDLNLPPGTPEPDLAELWAALSQAAADLGIAIVTGHTGRYDGCSFPTIGSATVIAPGLRDRYVTPAMARPGDAIILTKGAAVETAALFGAALRERLRRELGETDARYLEALFCSLSVVADARVAARIGVRDEGVTGMHDATEGGVWGGLIEMAEASGNGLEIDIESIPVAPEVRRLCDHFRIDPLPASSEGSLLITCRPGKAGALLRALDVEGIFAARIGEIVPRAEGMTAIECGRRIQMEPRADPFWPAFQAALHEEPES